jgi:hypothetical protein
MRGNLSIIPSGEKVSQSGHLDLSAKTRYTLKSGTKTPLLQEVRSSRTMTDLHAMFI